MWCRGPVFIASLIGSWFTKTKEVYQWSSKVFYSLESIVLTLAFMACPALKNPEQLKQCKPGELGRIIGLDKGSRK